MPLYVRQFHLTENRRLFHLQHLLDKTQPLFLKDLPNRIADLLGIRSLDTHIGNDTVQHELRGNTAWQAHGQRHGRMSIASRGTVRLQGRGAGLG